jgi:hypothetical protein
MGKAPFYALVKEQIEVKLKKNSYFSVGPPEVVDRRNSQVIVTCSLRVTIFKRVGFLLSSKL